MVKQTRIEIYRKVVEALRKGMNNTNSISNETGIRWETVNVTAESLVNAGLVIKEGNEYQLVDDEALKDNTYLGIPLEEDKIRTICEIANRIKQEKPTYPKTYLQKAVIEVIKRANLNSIPYGWYIYGECCALKLENNILIKYGTTTQYDKEIRDVINEFEPHKNVQDLLDYLYSKSGNQLYITKLDLTKLLKKEFTRDSIIEIETKLKRILWKFNKEDEKVSQYVQQFYSLFSRLKRISLEELEILRYDIINVFNAIWELIGTQEYLISVKKYFKINIKPYYDHRINFLTDVASEKMLQLEEFCPNLRTNPQLEKFKGSLEKQSQ